MTEFTVYHHGDMFVTRRAGQSPSHLMPQPSSITTLLFDGELSSAAGAVSNIACTADFEVLNVDGIWSEIQDKVTTRATQPWVMYLIHTLFGNVSYQKHCKTLHMNGLRALEHALAVSKVVHSEQILRLSVQRYNIDMSIGTVVQVSHGCFLEHSVPMLFRHCTKVVPRTEELCNVVHFQILNMAEFLHKAAVLGFVDKMDDSMKISEMKASVQITRIGHVTIRMSWKNAPCIVSPTKRGLKEISEHMHCIASSVTETFKCLC